MASIVSLGSKESYLVISPEGNQVESPKELYMALWDFLQGSKCSDSITIQFRSGGVTGLEASVKGTHK